MHKKKKNPSARSWGIRTGCKRSYGNQARILQEWGRLEEAMALHKKKEAICLELGSKAGLQRRLRQPGADPEGVGAAGGGAGAARKSKKRICMELGNKDGLWRSSANQAEILRDSGRLIEALTLLKKQEAIGLALGSRECSRSLLLLLGLLARAQGARARRRAGGVEESG